MSQKEHGEKFVGRKIHRLSKNEQRSRESGWQMNDLGKVRLNEYNSLYDPNMRHFFENKKVQKHLYCTGQIDRHGRVIDLDKNKSKLHVLEREFSRAEKIEERRQKDELEMRYRVQRKRFNELEKIRKEEILQKLKHDRELSKEIILTMRSGSSAVSATNSRARSGNNSLISAGSAALTPYDRAGMLEDSQSQLGLEGSIAGF
eukprot:GSChrysophyteH1.ASY1.ANO1.992.1 assembled CDS